MYGGHGRFVWLSLQRLGVHPPDLEDVVQDVFLIVHRRLESYDRRSRVTTWLFGICMRVAANYRRRRRWTWEVLSGGTEDRRPARGALADELLVRREEHRAAEEALEPVARVQAGDVRDVRDRVAVVPGDRRADERPDRDGLFAAARRAPPARTGDGQTAAGGGMSDPTRWRDNPGGSPVGMDVLLRGVRRPRAPRPDEQARMDAAINQLSRQTSFSSRALVAAGDGGRRGGHDRGARHRRLGLAGCRAQRRTRADRRRRPDERPDAEGARRGAGAAGSRTAEPPPAHKAVARHDTRAVRAPRRDRPAPVVAAAGPVAPTDTLVWETALVDAARRDLAAAPAQALASLETHRREFRHGQLAAEREFLAVEALRRLGRTGEARQRATELQAHYPNSSYAKRAARLLDAAPGNPPTTP